MDDNYIYRKGDVVKVYSLQSFHGGGFLDGEKGIVAQDQMRGKRNFMGKMKLDPSYEVYPQQLRLIKKVDTNKTLLEKFAGLMEELEKNE